MNKTKFLKIVLSISIVLIISGFSTSIEINKSPFSNEIFTPWVAQETELKLLIVDCESTLYSELYNLTTTCLTQEEFPYVAVQRKYDNLKDIIDSQFNSFDLLIISGSSNFLPDSPEVKDVASLLNIAIEKNKYVFGVCFGLQLLAYLLDPEEGKLVKDGSWDKDINIVIIKDDRIFKNIGTKGDSFVTRQYHNYSVPYSGKEKLGHGKILAKSKDGIEILRIGNVVATQFHPDSRYASQNARRIFQNHLKEFILYLKNIT
jgi:GMP synthase-like glutamine amidotransferase